MKLKLTDLHVQSFITTVQKNEQDLVKGGSVTDVVTQDCPTIPINVCNTINEIHCNLSIERCTYGITRCCI